MISLQGLREPLFYLNNLTISVICIRVSVESETQTTWSYDMMQFLWKLTQTRLQSEDAILANKIFLE